MEMGMEQSFTPQSTQNTSFGGVLPSLSLGSELKKTKPNKTSLENTKPKWSKLTQEHTEAQIKPLQNIQKLILT